VSYGGMWQVGLVAHGEELWEGQGVCIADDPASVWGIGRGSVCVRERTAEYNRMPGGP
jgi:hypothetical protein